MTAKKAMAISIVSVLLIACNYDKKEVVYPDPVSSSTCDTSAIKYGADVAVILRANCNGCHGGSDLSVSNSGGGFRLDNYTSLSSFIPNQRLMNSITHVGLYPMPKGGGKLSACDIGKIRTWIRNGYPNN